MNILYINHYAGSPDYGMEFRPYYLGREWVRQGHRVRILASGFSHLRTKNPDLIEGPETRVAIDGIDYRFYRTPAYEGNGLGRVRNIVAFLRHVKRRGRAIAREFRPDVVIASSTYPMDVPPAHSIAQAARAKLVFEVHDLWPLTQIELHGMSRWHPFVQWCRWAEGYAYRHADTVVSMLPGARDYMQSRGMAADKFLHVPNGVDLADWTEMGSRLPADLIATVDRARHGGRSVIGYAGSHGTANALQHLIAAAAELDPATVFFILVGNGPDKRHLQQEASRRGLDNIAFFDAVAKTQIPQVLALFDVAYLGWLEQPLYRFGISPNKLMDYMMAGLPIVHAVEAGNDPVNEAGCGVTVPPENPPAIAEGIRTLIGCTASEREAMGRRGRQFVVQHHDYAHLARKFLERVVTDKRQ